MSFRSGSDTGRCRCGGGFDIGSQPMGEMQIKMDVFQGRNVSQDGCVSDAQGFEHPVDRRR